jgi:hypothetical protein
MHLQNTVGTAFTLHMLLWGLLLHHRVANTCCVATVLCTCITINRRLPPQATLVTC